MGTEQNTSQTENQQPASDGLDLDSDAPLAPACDLTGDGTCEACQ